MKDTIDNKQGWKDALDAQQLPIDVKAVELLKEVVTKIEATDDLYLHSLRFQSAMSELDELKNKINNFLKRNTNG